MFNETYKHACILSAMLGSRLTAEYINMHVLLSAILGSD
jgi:hypothetical protein